MLDNFIWPKVSPWPGQSFGSYFDFASLTVCLALSWVLSDTGGRARTNEPHVNLAGVWYERHSGRTRPGHLFVPNQCDGDSAPSPPAPARPHPPKCMTAAPRPPGWPVAPVWGRIRCRALSGAKMRSRQFMNGAIQVIHSQGWH